MTRKRTDLRWVAFLAGLFAVVAGILVVLGWITNTPRLLDWGGTGITQKTNTAISALLAGTALMLLSKRAPRVGLARVLAVLSATLGALTLFQHITGIDLLIDTMFFDEPAGALATAAPNRMGPIAATSYVFINSAFLLSTAARRFHGLAIAFAVVTLAITTIPLIGYLYGADFLYTIPRLTGIAFQTTITFVVLSVGTMCLMPEHGIAAALVRNDAGGILLRWTIVPIIVLPIALGWITLQGVQSELYDHSFQTAALTFLLIVVLISLARYTAMRLGQSTAALAEQQRLYKSVTDNATTALFITDASQRCVFVNPAAERLTGRTAAEIYGQLLNEIVHRSVPARTNDPFADSTITALGRGEDMLVRKDGVTVDIEFTASQIRDDRGEPIGRVIEIQDITPRKRAEEQLQRNEANLRERDRRKNEFLATLAHELRNPLAAVYNAAQLVRIEARSKPELAEVGEILLDQVKHLVRLVEDLLDVSRITSGKISLRNERLLISEIIRQAVDAAQPLISTRGHALTVSVPDELLYVIGDLTRLVQVLGNLLNNAAKFTDKGGAIELTVEPAQHNARAAVAIRVRDNGCGIDSTVLDNLFDLFYQGDAPLDRSAGGLGIGLALVKRLVEMHGGTVTANSDGPGKGSEFTVVLPAAG